MLSPNYDLSRLSLGIDRGHGIEAVNGDLSAVSISFGCEIDSIQMAPQAGTCDLTVGILHGADWIEPIAGRGCSISYAGTTLFLGAVRECEIDMTPSVDPLVGPVRRQVSLSAYSTMYDLSQRQLTAFSAGQESGADRFRRLCRVLDIDPDSPVIDYHGLTTFDSAPTIDPYTGDAMSLFNALALTHRARWFAKPRGELVMRDDAPGVVLTFGGTDGLDYNSVKYGWSSGGHLSGFTATLMRDEKHVQTRRVPSPAPREEEYLVDVAGPDELAVWADSVPLSATPSLLPLELTTTDVAGIAWDRITPTSLVRVRRPGSSHIDTVAISQIQHEITPTRWTATLSLVPAAFVGGAA